MTHHKLSHGAWVFVSDGRKAPFLIDEGDEKFPNLRRLFAEELAGCSLCGDPRRDARGSALSDLNEDRGHVEILHGETSGAAREI